MMDILKKIVFATVITGMTLPVMADEKPHKVCDPSVTVEFEKMGEVNEAELQKQIDKVKDQMQRVKHARGSHVSQKIEMKRHIHEMQLAMTNLHNQMYAEGCQGAAHGASVDTRIDVLEKRLVMLEQMVSQLVDHLSEQQEETTK